MSNIPAARARLMDLAERAPNDIGYEILEIVEQELFRQSPIRRAPRKSVALTETLRSKIKAYAADHPNDTFHQIANVFGVAIGRVSEALNDVYRNKEALH